MEGRGYHNKDNLMEQWDKTEGTPSPDFDEKFFPKKL